MDASTGMLAKTLGGIGAAGAVSTAATAGVIYATGSSSEGESPIVNTTLGELEAKLKVLGVTEGCSNDATNNTRTCTLNGDKLKNLFHVLTGTETATATINPSTESNITLKAEKTTEDTDIFTEGFKFTIVSTTANIEVQKGDDTNNKVTIKKNTNTEFKMNTTNNKLEKAWNAIKLGKKAGLECINESSTVKCSLKTSSKINVTEGTNKLSGANATNEADKKISTSIDKEGYNQGIEFKVDTDIALTAPAGVTNHQITKLANNYKYEVKKDGSVWTLVKKNGS